MTNPSAQTMLELARSLRSRRIMRDGGNGNVYDIADEECEQAAEIIERAASAPAALRQAKAALIKIRACSIAGCEFGYGKPEIWGDALFASHGDVANALKVIDAVLSGTPEEASTEKQPICTHPNCSCAGRRCLAYDGSREEASTAAGEAVAWECGARKQGTAGGNYPSDCGWPICGCDPNAVAVLAALEDQGIRLEPAAAPPAAPPAGVKILLQEIVKCETFEYAQALAEQALAQYKD